MSREEMLREVRALFIEETRDYLKKMGAELIALEAEPSRAKGEGVAPLFRMAHSIKGAAGSVGFPEVAKIAAGLENVLSGLRSGILSVTPEMVDALLAGVDAVGQCVEGVGTPDTTAVITALALVGKGGSQTSTQGAASSPKGSPAPSKEAPAAAPSLPAAAASSRALPLPAPERAKPPVAPPPRQSATGGVEESTRSRASSTGTSEVRESSSLRVKVEHLDRLLGHVSEVIEGRAQIGSRRRQVQELSEQASQAVDSLERLALVGQSVPPDRLRELALQLKPVAVSAKKLSAELSRDLYAHRRREGDLSDSLRKIRTVPIASIGSLLHRAVRDAARATGKEVEFFLGGSELQIDRRLLEGIQDSLIHLLRNSVDHGLESPESRARLGKPTEGKISLVFEQRGGGLHVAVSDDGRGVVVEEVRKIAVARRLISQESAANLSREEVHELLFLPGFSTRTEVTDISGRGVGLDVVRTQVRALRGDLRIFSEPDQGTRIELSLPSDLSTLRVLLFRAGGQLLAVPTHSVERVLRFTPPEVQLLEGKRMLRTPRGLLPLVSMPGQQASAGEEGRVTLAIVLRAGGRRAAYAVDELVSEEGLMTRSLPPPLDRVASLMGLARYADTPVIILDAAGLASGEALAPRADAVAPVERRRRVLVADDSATSRILQSSLLEAAGYEVVLASDGLEALERLNQEPDGFIAVLSDVEMPRLDGFGLCQAIRNQPQTRSLPVVLLTSLDDASQRARGEQAGANAYLTKQTFEPAALLEIFGGF